MSQTVHRDLSPNPRKTKKFSNIPILAHPECSTKPLQKCALTTHGVQLSRLQAEYDSLEMRAAEQIQAALSDGAVAAQSARQQAAQSGDMALQEALSREAVLEQSIAALRAVHEVGSQ
jgi:hypothetical protein